VVPFGYGTDYALWVHENTTGYWVKAKNKKALAFSIEGSETIIVKRVWIPPNPNAKFLENPVLQHKDELPGELDVRLASYLGVA
jgi:hypothetical protein